MAYQSGERLTRRPSSWLKSKTVTVPQSGIDLGIDLSSCALHRCPL